MPEYAFSCEFSSEFDRRADCDAPRQTTGGRAGALSRPRYDHVATSRPDAETLVLIREIDDGIRRRTRAERERVEA